MTVTLPTPPRPSTTSGFPNTDCQIGSLLKGEILLHTQPHTAWGSAVTAYMYLPLARANAWQQLTDYPRWVDYFPDINHSEVLPANPGSATGSTRSNRKRLYQTANKNFILFNVQVEVHLDVLETAHQRILFCMRSGSFTDFTADLKLQDCQDGTLLSYAVQATPLIPVPAMFMQQAIQMDLPANMRNLRRVLCS